MSADLPVIRLRPKSKPQAIRHGFPWVFADEAVVDRRTRAIAPGSFAALEDAERRPMGVVTVIATIIIATFALRLIFTSINSKEQS